MLFILHYFSKSQNCHVHSLVRKLKTYFQDVKFPLSSVTRMLKVWWVDGACVKSSSGVFFFLNRLKSSYKDYKKNHIFLQILLFHCAHYDELLHCSVFSSAKDAQINIYGAKTAWFQVLHMYSLSRPSVISTLWKIQALYWFLGIPVICFIAIHNCIYLDETENTILEWNSVIVRKSTKISDWLKKHNTYLQIKNLSLIVQKWTYQESTAFLFMYEKHACPMFCSEK